MKDINYDTILQQIIACIELYLDGDSKGAYHSLSTIKTMTCMTSTKYDFRYYLIGVLTESIQEYFLHNKKTKVPFLDEALTEMKNHFDEWDKLVPME